MSYFSDFDEERRRASSLQPVISSPARERGYSKTKGMGKDKGEEGEEGIACRTQLTPPRSASLEA